jgi:nucleotide-binding universal stress UspA family protein
MKRILVPVDFSPTSIKAFRYAVEIASKSGGTITLYHLYTPAKSTTVGVFENIRAYNQQLEINNLKRLQRLKKKVLSDGIEVPVSTIVGRPPVVSNILGFAALNQIDMIIMGTQGASGLKKVVVGSVAARIIDKADIPVLLVPEKFQLAPPEKIAFTTTFQRTDRKALPLVFEIASLYDAVVTFVNLRDPNNPFDITEEDNFDTYAFSLQREYNNSAMQFKQLKTTSITKTMESLHEEIPYDLLVMARRKAGFLNRFFQKSFTKKMAYITKQPLLVVPEE